MTMVIDKDKLILARAKAGNVNQLDIGMSPQIAKKINNGEPVQVRVVIRLANALGVDPAEIVKEVNA